MRSSSALIVAVAGACVLVASAQEGPGLGVPATPEQIAGWDVSIGPNGEGLPPGSGTAVAGKAVYEAKCLACHGTEGAGQPNDRLVGGHLEVHDLPVEVAFELLTDPLGGIRHIPRALVPVRQK